jgi:ABC-type protease/lipase transport system fused ATPase/permease subunit
MPIRSNQVLHTLLAAAPPLAAPAAPPTTAPLPFTHWRKLVHTAHNVIVVGAPQSGKSTLTRAFLSALANSGQICLIDPHDQANDWDCLNWR